MVKTSDGMQTAGWVWTNPQSNTDSIAQHCQKQKPELILGHDANSAVFS